MGGCQARSLYSVERRRFTQKYGCEINIKKNHYTISISMSETDHFQIEVLKSQDVLQNVQLWSYNCCS